VLTGLHIDRALDTQIIGAHSATQSVTE
jgi:hypothetical protein